jgi:hypothetical protein
MNRLALAAIAALGCATAEPQLLPVDQAASDAATQYSLEICQSSALLPGAPAQYTASGASPGDTVHFLFGPTSTRLG